MPAVMDRRVDRAYVPIDFDVDEVGISLGYTRSFTLGT